MAYLTQAILEGSIGADKVTALTDGDGARLAKLIEIATARVRSALRVGGYSAAVPETVFASDASTCPPEISELAVRVWTRVAYAAKDRSIPTDQVEELDAALAAVRDGRMDISGLVTVDTGRGPGGIVASDANPDSTSERARPQIFSRLRMKGF